MPSRRIALIALTAALAVLIALTATGVVIGAKVLAADTPSAATLGTISSAGPPNTLTVVGQGNASATPDAAAFSLGASVTSPNVRESLAVDDVRMQSLLSALHAQGVQEQDIQTTTISVSAQSCCGAGIVTGYNVSNSVNVTVRRLSDVGRIIAAAVDAVGNEITIGGVNLLVTNQGPAITAARSAAMADANSRAKAWALLGGRSLGKILSVSEVINGQSQPSCAQGCGGGGAGAPIAAGQTTLTVSVTVTYELS
ncbi:MAG: SIMPL domain-containing protein [Candidatus Dormibacteraeota bacterium]|nr:SIMPL domain-containing protein [Candidatus Dormibacteraeota bacterium]MBV9524179.1 SIMPL domain-containing protein [Candidatus Dormibacteraeota bacterium]